MRYLWQQKNTIYSKYYDNTGYIYVLAGIFILIVLIKKSSPSDIA